ncbi:MAG: hypothetical protein IT359_10585 [Gemmatimonadaceae bacterium]|nr:hypothetical protein [Gemmatimonadaceae bacterium]
MSTRRTHFGSPIAALLLAAVACRTPAPTTALTPLSIPMRAELRPISPGVDSVRFTAQARIRNASGDTLTFETTCGGAGLVLQFDYGGHWRPVLDGVVIRDCLTMYTETRVAPGDSAVLSHVIGGARGERALAVRWVAPLPGRYRFIATASRCVRNTRRDCWVTLVSAPFEVNTVQTN